MTDYYKRLGIPTTSSADEIKKAYRQLSKKYHPDVNAGKLQFEELFKEIQEAYTILSNPLKKKDYDLKLQNYRLAKIKSIKAGKGIPHNRYSNTQRTKQIAPKINSFFVGGGIFCLLIVTILITYMENRFDENTSAIHTIDISTEQKKPDSLNLIQGFKPEPLKYNPPQTKIITREDLN